MKRETQHLLLVILGGAMIRLATGDVVLRYVRPGHRWLVLAAGAVIVTLGVVAYVRDMRASAAGAPGDHGHGADHGHGVDRHAPWLLLAPVLAVALVAPPALGADAVTRNGSGNAVEATDLMPPLPPGDGLQLTVAEFVQRAVFDPGRSLDDREVTLTGFVVRRGAAVDLARMTIVCCAADARANRVRLVGDLGDVAPDTWLRVRGTLQPGSGSAATRYVPAMTVREAEVVPQPPEPYEY